MNAGRGPSFLRLRQKHKTFIHSGVERYHSHALLGVHLFGETACPGRETLDVMLKISLVVVYDSLVVDDAIIAVTPRPLGFSTLALLVCNRQHPYFEIPPWIADLRY